MNSKTERVVNNSPVAIYLGCVGLLVGGVGVTLQSVTAGSRVGAPLFVQASLVAAPVGSNWPKEDASAPVAFHDEMIQILAPVKAEDAASTESMNPPALEPGNSPAAPAAQNAPEQQKESIRDASKEKAVKEKDPKEKAAKEKKAKTRTATRPQKPDNPVVIEDDVADDDGDQRQVRGPVEVRGREDVRSRGGYRYRVEREPESQGDAEGGLFRIFGPFYER
jgi:hypothetical protein